MSDRILSFILAMGLACLSLTAAEESAYEAGNGAPADFALGTEPWFITPVPDGEQAVVEALEFSYMSNTILRATGNVVLAYGDYRVYSDSVEYNTVTKILTSPGWTRVTYVAPEDLYEAMNKTSIAVDNEMGPFCYEILGENVIFAIGNAPTALIRLREQIDEGYRPKLIIGVPVGFVNVVASKERIIETDVPCIVARGRKGGSNVAACIVNALLYSIDETRGAKQ